MHNLDFSLFPFCLVLLFIPVHFDSRSKVDCYEEFILQETWQIPSTVQLPSKSLIVLLDLFSLL